MWVAQAFVHGLDGVGIIAVAWSVARDTGDVWQLDQVIGLALKGVVAM